MTSPQSQLENKLLKINGLDARWRFFSGACNSAVNLVF